MALFGLFAPGRWVTATCALGLVACGSTPASVQFRTDARLRVLPQEFSTAVGCSFASGNATELGHYVATLVDLGLSPKADTEGRTDLSADYPREAGSGVAAKCTSTTTFSTAASGESMIEVDHIYAAIIDGYAGGVEPDVTGKRSDENWAPPAWQWLCGIGGLDETQLDWLVRQVQLLRTREPAAAPRDAGASPTSDAGLATSTSLIDASAPEAGSTTRLGADASSNVDAATSTSTAELTASPVVSISDAGSALDAALVSDAASAATFGVASNAGDATASTSKELENAGADAGSAVTSVASATHMPTEASDAVRDAGATTDAGTRDWRAELLAAANGDFAPPPTVVSGGQSGVRGCVPLF